MHSCDIEPFFSQVTVFFNNNVHGVLNFKYHVETLWVQLRNVLIKKLNKQISYNMEERVIVEHVVLCSGAKLN